MKDVLATNFNKVKDSVSSIKNAITGTASSETEAFSF